MTTKTRCIIVDDEPVAREILESHIAKIDTIEVVASCKNALEAFQAIGTKQVDLIFLDINMPEISGLSLARSINKNIKIIFTTAYREYAVEGFDLQAVDYLLKPISLERLLQSVNKYLSENTQIQNPVFDDAEDEKTESFFVRSERKMVRINFSEILYIESLADYIKIYLQDKNVVTRETISSIEAKLPRHDFLRIHRSYIVAKKSIDSFTSEYIEIGKKQLPISRGYKEQVMKQIEN
ncbi:two component transcriptional regulator, LytTR family [Mariniphaga anaerophila]|uniref:Two component transcriptional regulator, LytTR family n=1 Tax=Mariniphaga anaerophila TaxID=1484053 RepID=A0A1M5EI80_9BACT|nr:LytTR family DNA-binding domain-containing protein [Mariniphaga anaerophila]SHF78955.1 two component transcriptional regulator, LytTR family [Mariniphaga anaerophila]